MANNRSRIEFTGSQGNKLSGLLESPDGDIRGWVLFAHCFTCGKDIAAASRISRALGARGFAVLRFDFTGLGSSDGDFANTNFSSNVDDLVQASNYLRDHHHAPSLLIGHSLGGTAILKAALEIPEARGVVTIGSPANAVHVEKLFRRSLDTINTEGEATVSLAGREFRIKKQFVDDIRDQAETSVGSLNKALLILHSPVDTIVSIDQAQKLYKHAQHPKSFISLDDADHLLSKTADAEYAAETITAWASRFLPEQNKPTSIPFAQPIPVEPSIQVQPGKIVVSERDGKFSQNVFSDTHHWIADEPLNVGGQDKGPDPYEHLLAALGTCTSMTIRMYADRKEWPLQSVQIELAHTRDHIKDCQECETKPMQVDTISRRIELTGNLTEHQRQRLMAIADKCPVHKTLSGQLNIVSRSAMLSA